MFSISPPAAVKEGCVEGHAVDPGALGAGVPETGIAMPGGANDVLVEVADAVGRAVGKQHADLRNDAVHTAHHRGEFLLYPVVFQNSEIWAFAIY